MRLEGTGLTRAEVEAKMLEPGYGRTSRRYALAVGLAESANASFDRSDFLFTTFGDLPNDPTFQDNLPSIFLK